MYFFYFLFFFNLQVALLFHSYHKCSESVFSFIRPAPLPFPILDNGITTSCSNQEPGSQTCLIPFPAPHQSLFHLFNISSILPQLPVSQNSFIEAYTSSLVEVWSLLWVQRHVYFKLCSREQVLEVVVLQFGNVWKGMGSNFRINIPLYGGKLILKQFLFILMVLCVYGFIASYWDLKILSYTLITKIG